MPDYDLQQVAALLNSGKSLTDIAATMDGPNDGPSPEELASNQARQAARTGGTPPGVEPPVDAQDAMLRAYREARAGGAGQEVAQSVGLSVLMTEALNGNPSAHYEKNRYDQRRADRQGSAMGALEAERQLAEQARLSNASIYG